MICQPSLIVSKSHRHRTRLWVCHMGHQTFKIKEDLGQFHTETTLNSRFPTSKVILPFVKIRVLILIFLIALRLFQSRDYTFFQTATTTATESDWLSFQPKNLSWIYWMGCVLWRGLGGGGVCTHPLSFSGDGSSQAGVKVAAGTKGKIFRF